jgi:hypothetical protein
VRLHAGVARTRFAQRAAKVRDEPVPCNLEDLDG